MKEREQYQQPTLPLDGAPRSQSSAEQQQPPIPEETNRHGEKAIVPSIAADPEGLHTGLASDRLPHDFWPEFHLEWEFREQHGMTPVSPAEFADMRDFSDGIARDEEVDVR